MSGRNQTYRQYVLFVLMVTVMLVSVSLAACGNDEAETSGEPAQPAPEGQTEGVETAPVATTEPLVVDALGTFDAKDPFVVQQVADSGSGGGDTSDNGTSDNGSDNGSDDGSGSDGGDSSDSGDDSPPSDVSNSLHYLTVLSIDVANGEPTVTFEVDEVIYEGKKEGDVVETGWGQIKVLEIDAEDQVVVFLHGSETRSLKVNETYLK